MRNRLISYENRLNSQLQNPTPRHTHKSQWTYHPHVLFSWPWSDFYEDYQDGKTCQVRQASRQMIFGNKPDLTTPNLDWADEDDVLVIEIRKTYRTGMDKEQSAK